jgi:hypothetical protein
VQTGKWSRTELESIDAYRGDVRICETGGANCAEPACLILAIGDQMSSRLRPLLEDGGDLFRATNVRLLLILTPTVNRTLKLTPSFHAIVPVWFVHPCDAVVSDWHTIICSKCPDRMMNPDRKPCNCFQCRTNPGTARPLTGRERSRFRRHQASVMTPEKRVRISRLPWEVARHCHVLEMQRYRFSYERLERSKTPLGLLQYGPSVYLRLWLCVLYSETRGELKGIVRAAKDVNISYQCNRLLALMNVLGLSKDVSSIVTGYLCQCSICYSFQNPTLLPLAPSSLFSTINQWLEVNGQVKPNTTRKGIWVQERPAVYLQHRYPLRRSVPLS